MYLLFWAVLFAVVLAVAGAGPIVAHRRRAVLRAPMGAQADESGRRAARASEAVVFAVAVSAVLIALAVWFIGFFGAGLGYSDAANGIPDHVRTQINLSAWVPAGVVVAAVLAAAVARRRMAVLVLGYVAPLLQLAVLLLVTTVMASLQPPADTGPGTTPAPDPYVNGCNGTPNPANSLPDCPTMVSSPSPVASS